MLALLLLRLLATMASQGDSTCTKLNEASGKTLSLLKYSAQKNKELNVRAWMLEKVIQAWNEEWASYNSSSSAPASVGGASAGTCTSGGGPSGGVSCGGASGGVGGGGSYEPKPSKVQDRSEAVWVDLDVSDLETLRVGYIRQDLWDFEKTQKLVFTHLSGSDKKGFVRKFLVDGGWLMSSYDLSKLDPRKSRLELP